MENGKRYALHMSVSVDIDRFTDRELQRHWAACFTHEDGRKATVAEVRAYCAEARAKGFEVFPPCDKTTPTGHCAGHPVEDGRS
jgi:hypothetical protein